MSKKPFQNVSVNDGRVQLDLKLDRLNVSHATAQRWLDTIVARDSTPFVPYRSGTLSRSVNTGTDFGSGEVVWDCVYARRCYYGLSMNFSDVPHPDAQAQWFEAAKAVHGRSWLKQVRKIGGGGQ
ncbi:MAG: minor capsid protein [Clostridia bacterium]|nr:minor capsid protein [Clostridia bacterium]